MKSAKKVSFNIKLQSRCRHAPFTLPKAIRSDTYAILSLQVEVGSQALTDCSLAPYR